MFGSVPDKGTIDDRKDYEHRQFFLSTFLSEDTTMVQRERTRDRTELLVQSFKSAGNPLIDPPYHLEGPAFTLPLVSWLLLLGRIPVRRLTSILAIHLQRWWRRKKEETTWITGELLHRFVA